MFGSLCVPGSSLRKLNNQRKNAKETQLDENHAYIYSLKNKSSWKIDGKSFALICHFSAMILHMRNILVDMLRSWGVENQASASKLPDTSVLCEFMSEWASSLTAIYSIPELKNEYTQCCASLQESQGKSVVFANLPTRLGAFLKENYSPFYNDFCVFEEEEGDEASTHSNEGEDMHDSETESEGEEGGNEQAQEQGDVAQEANTTLELKFCNEVVDEPDFEVETEDEVEAGEGSTRPFKSTTMDVHAPPLGTVPEEEEATFDDTEVAAFLTMLEDKDMECMFGGTPEALKMSLRKGQVKGSVEDVTLALLECKHAGTWEQKHLPIESTVPLSEHPQQLEAFNSFVEVPLSKKPLHDHKGVR